MQCGCPNCGVLMAQAAHDGALACVCPYCAHSCAICLGNNTKPLSREALKDHFVLSHMMISRMGFDEQLESMQEEEGLDEA